MTKKTRVLDVKPLKTEDGEIYQGWDLIEAIRNDERYEKMVLDISIEFPDPVICAVTCNLRHGSSISVAAASQSMNDFINDGTLGSSYVSAAVTKAKKYALMDFFGLKDKYYDKPDQVKRMERETNEAMNSLHERIKERQGTEG